MFNLFDKPIKVNSVTTAYIIPLFLFILAFTISFLKVTAQDICIDEPFSIYHAQFNLSDIIKWLQPTNNPPLYEIILHFWIKLFGISPLSVRVLPMLFSALAVIYIFKTGTRFFSLGVGINAALLYIFSTHAIYYAHDCRAYGLFIFLTSASLYHASKIVAGENLNMNIYSVCFINILMVYTHYFGFIVWFAEFMLIIILNRSAIKGILIGFTVALVLYLPQILSLIKRFRVSAATGTWLKEPNGIESIYNLLWKFSNIPLVTVVCILIVLFSLLAFFIRKRSVEKNKVKLFLISFFGLVFFGMFLVSYKIPVFNGRYLAFLMPVYYLMIALLASDIMEDRRYKFIFPLIITLLFMITVNIDPSKKREAKAVTDYVNSIKKPGDIVLICTQEFLTNYTYYTDKSLFKIIGGGEYGNLESELRKGNVYALISISELDPLVVDRAERVIYLDAGADFSNPGNNVLSFLQAKRKLADKKHFAEIFNVYTFNR